MKSETLGKLVSFFPGDLLRDSAIGEWYKKNPYHKFSQGDILILKDQQAYGYGIRPVALVNLYEVREYEENKTEGKYNITMFVDQGEHLYYTKWRQFKRIPKNVIRIEEPPKFYPKWSIEQHFRKVPDRKVEDALKRYKVNWW